MKRLVTITEQTFGRENPDSETVYRKREAARAVVINDAAETYLLHVTSHGYHKLAGGGIDDGEDTKEALKREILEELGCTAKVGDELGEVLEFRHYEDVSLEQYSYNYLAKQYGELIEQNLEQGEIDEGHEIVVASSIDDAISIMENDKPDNYEGEYIRLRDLTILKEARRVTQ